LLSLQNQTNGAYFLRYITAIYMKVNAITIGRSFWDLRAYLTDSGTL